MSTPEWDFFNRIEDLEQVTLELMEKADTSEPTLKKTSTRATDARVLAFFAFVTAFGALAIATDVENPRELKDNYIANLKQSGLSSKMLELVEKLLIETCELIEKAKPSK